MNSIELLWNDCGKTIRWELLCKEQCATNESDKIRLAEQVLVEPPTKTLAEWYSYWSKLYRIENSHLEQLVKQFNMAKLLHFHRLCKERDAITANDQIKIAEEVLSWGPMDSIGAGQVAWVQLKGAKSMESPPYKPTRLKKLLIELGKHFGKTTRWRALCKEKKAVTEEDIIKIAEQVLGEWSTGTVAELSSHLAQLNGVKSIYVK